MDVVAELVASCPPSELYHWVEDLERYPQWLEIISRAVHLGDEIWEIDLRARLGPLARSKRLQMIRTLHDGEAVRFERREHDGRDHSPWVLDAVVAPYDGDDGDSHLRMNLHYGGGLFGPVLERFLRDEISRSRQRLLSLVAT